MIKKLKLRFILTNMILVGIVLIIAFMGVFAFIYRAEKIDVEMALEEAMMAFLKKEPPFVSERTLSEELSLNTMHVCLVLTDNRGGIIRIYDTGLDLSEAMLAEAFSELSHKGEKSALISSLGLFYVKKTVPMGTLVGFTSSSDLQDTMETTFLICGSVCIFTLLLFLWISIMIASLAIHPIEEAWQQQKQFVADVSHDLKTPLTVILANNNILLSAKDSDSAERKWLESTEDEANRMRSLIDRMLELAGSENLNGKIIMNETNVSDALEAVLLQFEPVAFEKGVVIESEIAPNVRMVSNEDAWVRLFHILLDNALKYSQVGGTVHVSLGVVKQSVKLTVSNGGLIKEEDLPHLFERFYRADQARGVGGYGLGLSIAKNIAESLGGTIVAESNEDIGTRFTVTLKK